MLPLELVGRDVELALLGDMLESSWHGRGGLALLAGEPGIGKTSLANAISETAAGAGSRVLWGRCVEAGGQPAWWPFTQALSAVIESDAIDRDAIAAAGAAIASVLPEVSRLVPELGAFEAPETDTAAFAVARAVTRVLRAYTAQAPYVLIIDDVHAADPASLRLLSVLAGEARSMALLVVATIRDVEARQRTDVPGLIDDIMRVARVIRVNRLDDEPARSLLERIAPDLPATVANRAIEVTGGNPLFLCEVGALLEHDPHSHTIPIPAGVRETLRSRIGRLPGEARSFVEAVAVLGGEAGIERAAAIAGLESGDAVAAPAIELGILVHADTRRVRMSHGLVREVAYADIEPARRAALHVAAADWLCENALRPSGVLAEVARHLLAGGQPVAERAIATTLEAVDIAMERACYEDAIALLESARQSAETFEVPAADRVRLAIESGRALMRVGKLDEGRRACEQAAATAEAIDDHELVARAALARGSVFRFGRVDRGLVTSLRRAAELLAGRGDALEARVLARLAAAEQPSFDRNAPIEMAKRAIAMARTLDDSHTLLHALHDGMAACADFDHPRERLPFNLELRELAQQRGKPWFELRALTRLVFDHADVGETGAADSALEALDAVARRFSHPQHQWPVGLLRGMRAAFEGRFELADRHANEAIALGADDPGFRFTLFGHRYQVLIAAEKLDDAMALLDAEGEWVLEIPSGESLLAAMRAECSTRLGDRAAVVRTLPAAERVLAYQDPAITGMLAEAAVFAGDAEICDKAREQLPDGDDWFASLGAMWCFVREPLSRYRGMLEMARERYDDAIAHFELAVSGLRAANGRAFLARALLDLADALQKRGKPEDAARIATCREESEALVDELDQTGLEARVRAAKAGASSVSTAGSLPLVPGAPLFSLELEGEVWVIRCDDRTLRFKNSRGMRVLAQLIERPGEDIHVLDLVESRGPIDAGDSGELLDAQARAEYRARLIDVRDDLEEAERLGDIAWMDRLRAEAEMLESELARAFSFGGRSRRAGAAAERARSAVTRRVKEVIKKIRAKDAALGAHLAWAVKTGVVCSYRPEITE